MTFQVKLHIMKNLLLHYDSIHTTYILIRSDFKQKQDIEEKVNF